MWTSGLDIPPTSKPSFIHQDIKKSGPLGWRWVPPGAPGLPDRGLCAPVQSASGKPIWEDYEKDDDNTDDRDDEDDDDDINDAEDDDDEENDYEEDDGDDDGDLTCWLQQIPQTHGSRGRRRQGSEKGESS